VAAGAAKAKDVCQALSWHGRQQHDARLSQDRRAVSRYLSKALRDYKSGARKNAIMAGFAGTLSARDIDNVAAYYCFAARGRPRTKH
jgi:cytochrome c553